MCFGALVDGMTALRSGTEFVVAGWGEGPLYSEWRRHGRFRVAALERETAPPFHFEPFLKLLEKERPDVVFASGSPLYQEVLLAKWFGIPTAWWLQCGINVARKDGYFFSDPPLAAMTRLAISTVDRPIFPSEDTRIEFTKYCPSIEGRASVLPSAVSQRFLDPIDVATLRNEIRRGLGFSPDDIVFLCAGTIEARKNQKVLIEVFRGLLSNGSLWNGRKPRLLLLGGICPHDAASADYDRECRRAVVGDDAKSIVFLGPRGDPLPYFAAADFHVLVSTNEASPIANLEAMALGRPCVSSRVHGIPEVVEDGVNGFLVDPFRPTDVMSGLRRALEIFEKRDLFERMKIAARARVESNHAIARLAPPALAGLAAMKRECPIDAPPHAPSSRNRLQLELVRRWATVKGDAATELHLLHADRSESAARKGRVLTPRVADPSQRRVLVISHELSRTGAPIALCRAVCASARSSPSRRFVVVSPRGGPLAAAYADAGIETRIYTRRDGIERYSELIGMIREFDPDVIVANGSPVFEEVVVAKYDDFPVIWWIHENFEIERRDAHFFEIAELEDMVRTTLPLADRLVFPSIRSMREFAVWSPAIASKSVHIPNGLDIASLADAVDRARERIGELRRSLGCDVTDFVFVSVGSIDRRKNQARLLAAFQRLLRGDRAENARRTRLVLAGDSLNEPGFESLADDLKRAVAPEFSPNVVFAPARPDVAELFAIADAHVLVSTSECSPLVLLEAMAAGVPCVASRVGGIPELIAEDRCGILVDPFDVEDIERGLRGAMSMTSTDPSRREKMIASARASVAENHDVAGLSKRLGDLIDEVAATPRSPQSRDPGEAALLGERLVQRWSVFKADAAVDVHLARAECHRFFVPLPLPLRIRLKRRIKSVLKKAIRRRPRK